jgi:hypothetical protein
MTDRDKRPAKRPDTLWGPPRPPKREVTMVSPLAVVVLVAGIVCLLVVAWISANYAAGQVEDESPSLSFVYTIFLAPFLLASVPLLLIGSLYAVRPWSASRPWLPWAIVAVVAIAVAVALVGPGLIVS